MTVDIASLVSDNLDIWTTAVERKSGAGRGGGKRFNLYGIDRLRALILELAVQGRLVPQDPEDELAGALLKRIKSEKSRLVTAGKAKLGKPLSVPENWPFEIPANWAWSQLGYVTNYGQTEKADPGTVPPETWVLELEDVEKGTSRLLERVRCSDRPFQSQKNMFQAGDVVYGKLRPYLDKVIIADEQGVCTTEMVPMRGYGKVRSDYIRLFLKAPFFVALATEAAHGMNLPRLGTEKAREAPFSLPPLGEQQRIVAKVDELMALCDALETESAAAMAAHQGLVEALVTSLTASTEAADLATNWSRLETHFDTLFTTDASIETFKQTILDLAVSGKLSCQTYHPADTVSRAKSIRGELERKRLPAGWAFEKFANVLNIQGGGQPPKSKFSNVEKPGYVQLIQIRDLGLKPQPVYVPKSLVTKFCSSADIMVGRYGASVGKIFWGTDGAYNVALVKVIDKHGRFLPTFLFNLLCSPTGQSFFSGMSRSAQAGFNKADLAEFVLPIPPLAEQRLIVAKVNEIMTLCDQLKSRLAEAAQTQRHLADAITEHAAAA